MIPRAVATVRRRSTASRRVRVRVSGEDILQLFGIYAGIFEGTAPAAVREREQRGPAHVVRGDDATPFPGGQSPGGLRGHEVAAQPVHAELRAQVGYLVESLLGQVRGGEAPPSLLHAAGELLVVGGPPVGEGGGISLVAQAAADYLDPLGCVVVA
jgi:hypothetical protein